MRQQAAPLITPAELEVNYTGQFRGKNAKLVYILGQRSLGWDSTTLFGDVARYLDTSQSKVNAPNSATTYYINSTSVQDLTAGTGVDRVRIVYLDASGNQQVMTASLNGTTAVSIGSGIAYVQWMESYHSVTASREAAGDLTISSINGVATVATTIEMIAANGNRSMSARYKVPTGKNAYLIGWDSHAINATMDVRLRATVFADDRALANAHHFQDAMYLPSGTADDEELDYLCCPAGSEIKVSAIPGSAPAGNRCNTTFRLLLVDQ